LIYSTSYSKKSESTSSELSSSRGDIRV
jgi:hypothetical protein